MLRTVGLLSNSGANASFLLSGHLLFVFLHWCLISLSCWRPLTVASSSAATSTTTLDVALSVSVVVVVVVAASATLSTFSSLTAASSGLESTATGVRIVNNEAIIVSLRSTSATATSAASSTAVVATTTAISALSVVVVTFLSILVVGPLFLDLVLWLCLDLGLLLGGLLLCFGRVFSGGLLLGSNFLLWLFNNLLSLLLDSGLLFGLGLDGLRLRGRAGGGDTGVGLGDSLFREASRTQSVAILTLSHIFDGVDNIAVHVST